LFQNFTAIQIFQISEGPAMKPGSFSVVAAFSFVATSIFISSPICDRKVIAEELSLAGWRNALASEAGYLNCYLVIEGEIRSIAENQLLERTRFEIAQRGDWYRIKNQRFDSKGIEFYAIEMCSTDQLLNLQGRPKEGSPSEMSFDADGNLENWDRLVERNLALGVNSFVFGQFYHPPPSGAELPEFLMKMPDGGRIDIADGVELESASEGNGELPTEITEHYFPWYYTDAGFDTAKRDRSVKNILRLKNISWELFDGIPLMARWEEEFLSPGQPPAKHKIINHVVVAEFGIEHPDEAFLPTYPIQAGSPVAIQDLPVQGTWDGNRIVPSVATNDYRSFGFISSTFPMVVYLALFITTGVLGYVLYRRTRRTGTPVS
jgi:hypothetical protein